MLDTITQKIIRLAMDEIKSYVDKNTPFDLVAWTVPDKKRFILTIENNLNIILPLSNHQVALEAKTLFELAEVFYWTRKFEQKCTNNTSITETL